MTSELCFSFRQQQHSHDIKISEAYNELKIKTAESQQTQILYDETIRNLQESQRSAEKTQKKLEVRIFSDSNQFEHPMLPNRIAI